MNSQLFAAACLQKEPLIYFMVTVVVWTFIDFDISCTESLQRNQRQALKDQDIVLKFMPVGALAS